MSLIVGLTGGIGCGKSSVTKMFAELGATIIDTDAIAHRLTQADGLAMPAITSNFGAGFLTPDGALDRAQMRDLIFSDAVAKTRLEAILHPLILPVVVAEIARHRNATYILLVVPLLLETQNYLPLIQRILVVDCDEQQQISRTMARSQLSEATLLRIMASQTSRQQRLRHADDIILNQNQPAFTAQQIIKLHQCYETLASSSNTG